MTQEWTFHITDKTIAVTTLIAGFVAFAIAYYWFHQGAQIRDKAARDLKQAIRIWERIERVDPDVKDSPDE